MKRIVLLLLLVAGTVGTVGFGQSMFFDSLNHSSWIAPAGSADSIMYHSSQIPISKLLFARDSIHEDVIIWTFSDGVLRIAAYDHRQKKDSVMATYAYKAISDKGILQVRVSDEEVFNFEVGLVSTGNHAVLFRKGRKGKSG